MIRKREKIQVSNIVNDREGITTDPTSNNEIYWNTMNDSAAMNLMTQINQARFLKHTKQ